MSDLRSSGYFHGKVERPQTMIVCNFTKPTADKPALLTLEEVNTMFHEFGHALHSLLSQVPFGSLSGTSVYWDFVELPSQIMENWLREKETLDMFAEHLDTGEKISADLIDKIKQERQFMTGYDCVRQLSFALLDLGWHGQNAEQVKDLASFENEAMAEARVLPAVEGTNFSCAFSHIFSGGYSAGYYSYKWAEVLDADAYSLFKEKGIYDKETAASFQNNILAQGNLQDPLELFIKFRGRKPDIKPLLERDGLTA